MFLSWSLERGHRHTQHHNLGIHSKDFADEFQILHQEHAVLVPCEGNVVDLLIVGDQLRFGCSALVSRTDDVQQGHQAEAMRHTRVTQQCSGTGGHNNHC